MKLRGALTALLAATLIGGTSATLAADVTPFEVTLPTVTGPIPSTETSFPFGVEGFDPQPPMPEGYVAEEYFISGTGNIYEYTPTGVQIVASCPAALTQGCTNIPYTTRLVVKRPKKPQVFSGTVVVQPLNPSAGYDGTGVWSRSYRHFVRNGDIWIGYTAKSVAINALKTWDPVRYAPLNWTYAPFTPGNNSGPYDGITFDVGSQIGALIKLNGPTSPIHKYNVKRVFEAGFSQEAAWIITRAGFFHKLARLPDGSGIYDGYVPMGNNGPANINFGVTPAGALAANDPRRAMPPREVPVMHLQTETEVVLGARSPTGLLYRRPDSDAPNDRFRLWEVPGASHVSNDNQDPVLVLQLTRAQLDRTPVEALAPLGCAHTVFEPGPIRGIPGVVAPTDFPFSFTQNAAFEALTRWIDDGVPPPHVPWIELDTSTTPATIARDEFGNAKGGLRTPYLDVPVTTYASFDTIARVTPTSGFCILFGYHTPFDSARLASLYRNHGDYMNRFVRQTHDLVDQRLWLKPDARFAIKDALRVSIP